MTFERPPQLSKQEMMDIFKTYETNPDAWKKIVEGNLRLADKVVGHYKGKGVETDDLYSMAFIGLINAAKNFNPDLGFQFSTYACKSMYGEIGNYFQRKYNKTLSTISFDTEPIWSDGNGEFYCADIIESDVSIEQEVFDDLWREEVLLPAFKQLNVKDQQAIYWRIMGYRAADIAKYLNISQRAIYYASTRLLRNMGVKKYIYSNTIKQAKKRGVM